MGEQWARTFEPEGAGGYAGYGGEAERREETRLNKEAEEASRSQSALDLKDEREESLRRKRNTMFQTAGGSSGVLSESVGARETYFGN